MGTLAGWAYRKAITIAHTDDGAQTDYQMKVTLYKGTGADSTGVIYLNNRCLNWPNDILFTLSDGTTTVGADFWREESDATDGTWWLEANSIPAHPDDFNGYIYYGKVDAADASSITATALSGYGDDLEPDKSFIDSITAGGVVSLSTTYAGSPTHSMKFANTVTAATSYNWQTSATKTLPGLNRIRVRCWYYAVALASTNNYHHIMIFSPLVGYGPYVYASASPNGNVFAAGADTGFACSTGAWHIFELDINFTTSKYDCYVDGTMRINQAPFVAAMANNASVYLQAGGSYSANTAVGEHYYDNYFMRKYTANEPTWGTTGAEEVIYLAPRLNYYPHILAH